MISYVAPTRLSTFYAHFIIKIGSPDLNCEDENIAGKLEQ